MDRQVTLRDVELDRMHFAEAQRHLRRRAPLEWALGSSLFSAVLVLAIWLMRTGVPLTTYIFTVALSFLIGGLAVFLNGRERDKWYSAKAVELDGIEKRIRLGERVLPSNPKMQPNDKKQPAADEKRYGE